MTTPRHPGTPTVDLSHGWACLPRGRPAFERLVRQQRRRLAARGDLSAADRRGVELALRQAWADAVPDDVHVAAVLVTTVGAAEGLQPSVATCTLATLDRRRVGTELPLTVHTILAALTRSEPPPGVAPETVELGCGPAVRLVRMLAGDDVGVPWLSVAFLVPYDAGERAALLTFGAPNIERSDRLMERFDDVARSLQVVAGAEAEPAAGRGER